MIFAQTITDTADNFEVTVKALALTGIAILTLALAVMTGARARSFIPAFGVLLLGAAMYWMVNAWDTTVRPQVEEQLNQDAGGGGGGGGPQTGPNTGG